MNVLSDLGVKRSAPKLNYYLVLDFLIFERGRMCCAVMEECSYLLRSRVVYDAKLVDAKASLVLTQSQ